MDFGLLAKGLDYTTRQKKWVLILAAFGFTSYRIYNSPSLVERREKWLKLLSAFVSVAEMVSDTAETIGILSIDLKEFIQSDSDQIPNSSKQLLKITRLEEFSHSVNCTTEALTVGILCGYNYEAVKNDASVGGNSGFFDGVMNKLFSDSGSGFASVVVGSFARNLVMGFYSDARQRRTGSNSDYQSISRWIELANEDKSRELIGNCIQLFVSTAVSVYLEKTMDLNTYDEIFSGLTNPKHENEVKDLLVTVCNGAIETLIHTSHQVLTKESKSKSESNLSPPYWKVDFGDGEDNKVEKGSKLISTSLQKRKLFNDEGRDGGWRSKISSTLAVPSSRQFVLDMTGKVTFETVRSFLEFLLERMSDCMKRSVDVGHQEVVDLGIETVRYVSGKSSAVGMDRDVNEPSQLDKQGLGQLLALTDYEWSRILKIVTEPAVAWHA